MPVSLPYLNNNSGRSFPIIEDSDVTGSYGISTMQLSPDVILDVHLVCYLEERQSLTLDRIVVNGPGTALTAHFDYNSTDLALAVSAASEWPYRAELRTADVNDNTEIFLSVVFGEGVEYICEEYAGETITFNSPEIEPSCVTSYDKHKIDGITGAYPGSVRLSGDVYLEDGYNIESRIVKSQNLLRLNAVPGAGLGRPCSTLLPEPTNCDGIIYYINGLHPNWYGDFRLIAGPGIEIIPGDATITVRTSVDRCRPKCKDDEEVN